MKLTNTVRQAFIRAVMADVPCIDYAQMARNAVTADIVSKLPKKVAAVWADTSLRGWIKTDWNNYEGTTVTHPSPQGSLAELAPETIAQLRDWKALDAAQRKQREELESKLVGCVHSVTTRKALVSLLPEFEKYLPADDPAALRTLPVVANVVTDFVKAGWPKNKVNT